MFQGMSTNPPESTGTASPDGAPTAVDQAKADAGTVAAAALKGAATRGAAGAAIGALQGAAKTKTGRNIAIAAVAAPVLAIAMLTNLVFGAAQATTAVPAGRGAISQTAAMEVYENKDELRGIQDAATQTGTSWQILAGIHQAVKSRSGDNGTGPFGIDMSKTNGEITEADANSFDKAALYIARKLQASSRDTVGTLQTSALDTGYMDTRGPKGENVMKPSEDEEAKKARDEIRKQYVAAISAVPVKNSESIAESVFNAATSLATGSAAMCNVPSVGAGGPSTGSLNATQTAYAQEIINQVAAKGMPENAAIIALATALQESTLLMYWNAKVPGSQELANGGPEGSDHYSVGLFQQQVNGSAFSWGTVQDAMNPAKSTDMFLEALLRVDGWQDMALTKAAQLVQRSAFPDAYADDEVTARRIVGELKPATGSYGTTTSSGPAGGATTVSSPLSGCGTGGTGTGASGKGDDYPFKDAQIYTPDPWGLYFRECTSFAAWRVNVQMGYKEGDPYPFTVGTQGIGLFGDGGRWGETLGSKYPVDMTPKAGAVAWWGPWYNSGTTITQNYGHVGIVGAVNPDGTVVIEEYNWGSNHMYNSRTIPASDVTGYIHIADIP